MRPPVVALPAIACPALCWKPVSIPRMLAQMLSTAVVPGGCGCVRYSFGVLLWEAFESTGTTQVCQPWGPKVPRSEVVHRLKGGVCNMRARVCRLLLEGGGGRRGLPSAVGLSAALPTQGIMYCTQRSFEGARAASTVKCSASTDPFRSSEAYVP
jgi:hypothetical protein